MDPIEELINFWRPYEDIEARPCIHTEDKNALQRFQANERIVSGVHGAKEFFQLAKTQQAKAFHLSLSPVPYMGDLKCADIFLLMINPSVGYSDYGTDAKPEFREALAGNRTQRFGRGQGKCMALDPECWWTSWFSYYERFLQPVIWKYATTAGSYLKSLEVLSRRLAILELVPYYSANATDIDEKFLNDLESAKRAKGAAKYLAKMSEALVIVRWSGETGENRWGLKSSDTVILNRGPGFAAGQEAILKTSREVILMLRRALAYRSCAISYRLPDGSRQGQQAAESQF